jgi:hypothetical protein
MGRKLVALCSLAPLLTIPKQEDKSMTEHDQPTDKTSVVNNHGVDTADTGKKLLQDAHGGQWLKGHDQGMTKKLQDDGVLPSGEIFDPAKVRQHLGADQQADQAGAKALEQLHSQNTAAKQAIESGKAADKSVQTDFKTVNSAWHEMIKKTHDGADPNPNKSTITKADLEGLAKTGSPDVKAAAQRLLGNWDKNSDFTSASADKGSPAAIRNATDPFINEVTLTKGMHKHEQARTAQEQDLKQAQAKEQQAQAGQTKLEQTIKDEQQSLTATDKFTAAVKIQAGNGYYQAADRLLNLDGQQHTEAERKVMTRLLQEQVAAQHGGKLPKYLTTKDLQLSQENVDKLFDRMKEIADKT